MRESTVSTPLRVLLTGFEPFGGETTNPSMQAALAVGAAPPGGIDLTVEILPVSCARTPEALRAALARHRPDVAIATGQAGGRPEVAVERIGINLFDLRIPDNDGAQPLDTPVVPGAPAAYFATLPVKRLVAAMREVGVPAAVSNSAGTHLCNATLFLLGHLAATEYPGLRAGFIHLPWLPAQTTRPAGAPSMSLATQVSALQAALAALASGEPEPQVSEGALH